MHFELKITGYAEKDEIPDDLIKRILKVLPVSLVPMRFYVSGTNTTEEQENQEGVQLIKKLSHSTVQDVKVYHSQP